MNTIGKILMHMIDMRLHNAMRNVCQFEFSKHHFTKSSPDIVRWLSFSEIFANVRAHRQLCNVYHL